MLERLKSIDNYDISQESTSMVFVIDGKKIHFNFGSSRDREIKKFITFPICFFFFLNAS